MGVPFTTPTGRPKPKAFNAVGGIRHILYRAPKRISLQTHLRARRAPCRPYPFGNLPKLRLGSGRATPLGCPPLTTTKSSSLYLSRVCFIFSSSLYVREPTIASLRLILCTITFGLWPPRPGTDARSSAYSVVPLPLNRF